MFPIVPTSSLVRVVEGAYCNVATCNIATPVRVSGLYVAVLGLYARVSV